MPKALCRPVTRLVDAHRVMHRRRPVTVEAPVDLPWVTLLSLDTIELRNRQSPFHPAGSLPGSSKASQTTSGGASIRRLTATCALVSST